MFGGRSPFGRAGGGGGFSRFSTGDDEDMEDSGYSGFPSGFSQRGPRKAPAVHREFECTLEDLYKGCTKKMKLTKTVYDNNNGAVPVEKILQIDVKPGWKAGTKVTFEREGDEKPGIIASDIVFVLREKPHSVFQREGNNLVYTAHISLRQALTNPKIELASLDGRRLSIQVNNVISPDYIETVKGEGMPISKSPGSKGDLLIKFVIDFPRNLSQPQREQLAKILS